MKQKVLLLESDQSDVEQKNQEIGSLSDLIGQLDKGVI